MEFADFAKAKEKFCAEQKEKNGNVCGHCPMREAIGNRFGWCTEWVMHHPEEAEAVINEWAEKQKGNGNEN